MKRIIRQISNVKIKAMVPDILGMKDIEENIKINKAKKQNNNSSLHIIYNKYYFNLVSPLTFKKNSKKF